MNMKQKELKEFLTKLASQQTTIDIIISAEEHDVEMDIYSLGLESSDDAHEAGIYDGKTDLARELLKKLFGEDVKAVFEPDEFPWLEEKFDDDTADDCTNPYTGDEE